MSKINLHNDRNEKGIFDFNEDTQDPHEDE